MRETVGDKRERIEWVDNKFLADLNYADDVLLMSRSIHNLQTMVSRLEEKGKGAGLTITVRKTEVMKTDQEIAGNIQVEDQIMEEVPVFKYLGTLVRNDGSLEDEFQDRIRRGYGYAGQSVEVT
ncbi:uncharacterized protein LOC121859576 [Homarus americanus]|uniref:uncharacterized protein LOC121859576 n=1 Tax=Homarus americanus TaxID=6706 RepID=UPI001C481E13|nr:uncharacterized protein LOC121859576 [Homarus americanus]